MPVHRACHGRDLQDRVQVGLKTAVHDPEKRGAETELAVREARSPILGPSDRR